MPFTPFHFGPHACVALPLHRYIDIPVFIGANVIVDIEPLMVMSFNLDYPLHGYCHTLLIGGLLGLLWAVIAFPLKPMFVAIMGFVRFPYNTTFLKMAISGITGVCLHVLFDATIYKEMNPFFPSSGNPLYGVSSYDALSRICLICFMPALTMYGFIAARNRKSKLKNS